MFCVPEFLRAEALENGTVILGGITLAESTPIADIEVDRSAYAGQHLRVEGIVIWVCSGGNRATIQDPEGNRLPVAGHQNVSLRSVVGPGQYLIAEGIYTFGYCRRPPHLLYGDHGALAGTITCPID